MLLRALIVDSDEKLVALMTNNLINEFEAGVARVSSANEALLLLKNEPHFDIIITRDKIGDENTTQILASKLYENKRKYFLFVIGNTASVFKDLVMIPEKFRIEDFNRTLIKTLGITKNQMKTAKLPDYLAIPIKSFYFINSACCDIYIKLKRKEEDQYIKRLFAGDNFDQSTIKRYEEQGLTELFIEKENRKIFLNVMINSSTRSDSSSTSSPISGSQKYALKKELLNKFGLSEEIMELANISIKEMQGKALKNKKFGALLKELLKKEESYAYQNAQLICFLSALVLPKVEMGKGKLFESAMEKMCYVAFFHDLLLINDELGSIKSKLSLHEAKLDDKTKELVLNHANLMATMFQSQSGLPRDIDQIIRQHHGVFNGVGFFEMPNINIGPYAILFIVLEDFSEKILHFQRYKNGLKEIFNLLYEKYSMPSYKKILDALKSGLSESI